MRHDTELTSFEQRLREGLSAQAEALDEITARRLRMARHAALEGKSGRTMWSGAPAAVFATVIAAVVAVGLWLQTPDRGLETPTPDLEDVAVLSEGDVEFYEELEFIQWLAEQQSHAHQG